MPNANQKKYKQALISFLSKKYNVIYNIDHEFDDDVLNAITDTEVVDWLKVKSVRK